MRSLRATLLILGFFLFTLPLMPVQALLRSLGLKAASTFPHWYHRKLCRLLGVTIHTKGAVADDRPVLLVANHISWLDIPVLSAVTPLSFVAKSEVGTWPFISWLARLQGTIFIDRERRLKVRDYASGISERLRGGEHILIFAEGTSSDGNCVLPFRSSLFAAVAPTGEGKGGANEDIYVQTLAIAYTHQQGLPLCRKGRPVVAWYGDMDIASHAWALLRRGPLDVHVHIGEPVELESYSDRKSLAAHTEEDIRRRVAAILTPRQETAPEKG